MLDSLSFSCGSQLKEVDLDLPDDLLSAIFVRGLQCTDPVEAPYYSADTESNKTPKEYYPQCKTVWTRIKSREKTLKSSADLFVCSVKMQF